MRQLVVTTTALALALVLAACGTGSGVPPTATSALDPNLPTAEPGEVNLNPFATPVNPRISETENPGLDLTLQAIGAPVTIVPTGQPPIEPFAGVAGDVDVPPPGVRVTSVPVEADDEVPPQEGPYELVELLRAGGPTGNLLTIQFLPDGSIIINDEFARNIGPQGMGEVQALLDEFDVFGTQGIFRATIPNPDDYLYNLRVVRAGSSKTIQADDTLIPTDLALLIDRLIRIADGGSQPPPPPPPRTTPATPEG